jgi:ornithine cyclodeaminase/alanine dehydrogenase-like protein (mu-crystallin family)
MTAALGFEVAVALELAPALERSDVCVTCTPSRSAFLMKEHVRPGTFVAAVGADNSEKQELDPRLMKAAVVVTDVLDQCAAIGDLHHAVAAGVMAPGDVYAELAELVSGAKPPRRERDAVTVFDSTGTALEDVAAAAVAYENALAGGVGLTIALGD